ncbi:MAG: gamma-glutamyltransferase [Anaerolineae bacterium]|nr:gamma-glutamyltransferase [Anaerolineae bacterium]
MPPPWPDLVVAPQPLAVEVGATVLAEGGNAVDAAVAAALVQGVADPQMCGIGGFGALQHYDAATGRHTTLQFPGTAGSLIREDMWQHLLREEYRVGYGFRLAGYENDVGWQSVATPGTVAGLAEAHRRWGSQPWGNLVEPAARLAEDGLTLTPTLTDRWRRPGTPGFAFPVWRITHTLAAQRIFTRDGFTPLQLGEKLVQTDLRPWPWARTGAAELLQRRAGPTVRPGHRQTTAVICPRRPGRLPRVRALPRPSATTEA